MVLKNEKKWKYGSAWDPAHPRPARARKENGMPALPLEKRKRMEYHHTILKWCPVEMNAFLLRQLCWSENRSLDSFWMDVHRLVPSWLSCSRQMSCIGDQTVHKHVMTQTAWKKQRRQNETDISKWQKQWKKNNKRSLQHRQPFETTMKLMMRMKLTHILVKNYI